MSVQVTIDRDRLSPAMREMVARMPDIADQIIRKLAFDIVANVAERVPVDTGRYRAGWRVSLDILTGDGESETVSIEEVDETITVTVTNPVEYGPEIEFGTSKRAPGLHLQTAIAAARASLGIPTIADPIAGVWEEVT
jgi:hypothetical protein